MPMLVRENPKTPCQPDGAHHPHRMICGDPDCDCWQDADDGQPFNVLTCCIDGEDWPCNTKRGHEAARRAAHDAR
jgi:hypothetical protein